MVSGKYCFIRRVKMTESKQYIDALKQKQYIAIVNST